jgi:transcriptional regulator with XRE-family HTH domain
VDTLGQFLRQAREAHHWSLRQTAAQLRRPDGVPITPQYLHDLEHNRRHPSLHLVEELATVLHLDPLRLVVLAGKELEVIQRYLREYPTCATAVTRFFLLARQSGFAAWERLLPLLAQPGSPFRDRRGAPRS